MRSVLSVHCSCFSWRDMHKFASIYDMPSPLEHMPPAYLNKIEATINSAVEESIQPAPDELHERVDSEPSPVADCINTAVSFDSCWKTRGFNSNVGFGSAISAINKNVLDFVLFNRTCELCSRCPAERQEQHREYYDKCYDITHKANCRKNFSGPANLWSPRQLKLFGGDLLRNVSCVTQHLSRMRREILQPSPRHESLRLTSNPQRRMLGACLQALKKRLCAVKKNTKNLSHVQ